MTKPCRGQKVPYLNQRTVSASFILQQMFPIMYVHFHASVLPVVEFKAGPPVWCPEQRLQSAGQIDKHVAH